MRWRRQRGMTLVELLVAMAVTAILMVGLAGAFLNATSHYQDWANRINDGSVGDILAANLQADSHRYVLCGPHQFVSQLNLCWTYDLNPADAAVRYAVSSAAPYIITRQTAQASAAFMARGQTSQQPQFLADCSANGSTVSGHINVYYLRSGDGAGGTNQAQNFMVYYSAPAPWGFSCS